MIVRRGLCLHVRRCVAVLDASLLRLLLLQLTVSLGLFFSGWGPGTCRDGTAVETGIGCDGASVGMGTDWVP